MSPKSLVLVAGAVLVLGMGLYLMVQVKSSPAEAQAPSVATHASSPSPSPTASPTHTPSAAETQTAHVQATAARPSPTQPGAGPELQMAPMPDEAARPNIKMDSMMELANKAYDAQDFDQAIAIAGKVLAKDPTNVRMMRIMVSANCIAGDATVAQTWYEKLPQGIDRQQMKIRCERYQVSLKD